MTDPTYTEMLEFLVNKFAEADMFEISEAIWWFCNNHHSGQSSNLYSALCLSRFTPSRIATQHDDSAHEYYVALVEEYAPEYRHLVKER